MFVLYLSFRFYTESQTYVLHGHIAYNSDALFVLAIQSLDTTQHLLGNDNKRTVLVTPVKMSHLP